MKKFVLFFCVAMLLAGCGSAPIVQSPSQLAATHGYVFASLPKGSTETIALESVKDKSTYVLQARTDAGIKSVGLWIPAGEYKLAKWQGYDLIGYPPVVVQQGRVTDLGGLIPLSIGDYKFVVLPVRHAEISSNADVAINDYRTVLLSQKPLDWVVDITPKAIQAQANGYSGLGLIVDLMLAYERERARPSINKQLSETESAKDFFQLAKAATPPLTGKFEHDALGNLFYGADFGQIRMRSVHGEWSNLDTGSLHSVTAIKVEDKFLIAGFDNGVIRASEDGGASWKELVSLGRDARIMDIEHAGDKWIVAVARDAVDGAVWKKVGKVEVYATKANDLQDLVKVKVIARPEGFQAAYVFPLWAEVANGNYYISGPPDLFRMSLSSMEWKTVTPPIDISGFHTSAKNGVVAAYLAKGAFSKLYLSTDDGNTWSKYDSPPYTFTEVRFASSADGQAVRWSAGLVSASMELMRYDKTHDSWSRFAEVPSGCTRTLPDATGMARFCITRGGSILSYTDSKWVAEFAVD